jgi:DNA polymerase sigma
LGKKLRYDRKWEVQSVVKNCNVPFIRALYVPSNIWVDITFSSGIGVKNTFLLRHLFEMQPEAAKFCMFIRKLLKLNGFKIKNYVVILLAIFYLQQKNFLPSIQTVQHGIPPRFIQGKILFHNLKFSILI